MQQMILVGVAVALVHGLLYWRLVAAPGLPGWARISAAVFLSALGILAVIAVGAGNTFAPGPVRPLVWLGQTWYAVLFYLLLGLIVIGVVLVIARLAGYSRRSRLLQALSALVVVASVGTVAYGVAEAEDIRIVEAQARFADLPPQLDGLRIAVVGDLHVGAARGPEFTERVVELVNAQRPDLIVLPGDLLDGSVELVGPDVAPIAGLRSEYGTFGVAGNHEGYVDDVGQWMDFWESLGIETLRNQRTEVPIDGVTIEMAGVYDYDAKEPYAADIDAALAGRDPSRFTMLIAHQPLQAIEAGDRGVDLQLSGHTHGGQMWPFVYLVRMVNPTVSGLDRIGDLQIYTTRGAGAWGPPVRVGAPPDISILTLRRG
ncbi:metallophosphoesterase [Rhodococcus sp. NPDC057014]|uniref:metallophosphoesterase n=1 Tax=Rhodococcus sp. NPDC057014 TaxID=3346000 RepID=UPI003627D746